MSAANNVAGAAGMAASATPAAKHRRRSLVPLLLQTGILAATGAALAWVSHNAAVNLAARHVASGFGFLSDTAGFSISESLVPYTSDRSYLVAFAAGMANTLSASLPSVLLATVIGLTLGIVQVGKHVLLRTLARICVDLLRNIPLLVQLLVWYIALLQWLPLAKDGFKLGSVLNLSNAGLAFATPVLEPGKLATLLVASAALLVGAAMLRGRRFPAVAISVALVAALWAFLPDHWSYLEIGTFDISGGERLSIEWCTLVLGLSLYSGVYCAEIVRSGLLAVRRGQWEAAHALSLTRSQTLWRIILPQSLRVIVPPYTSLVMNTIKNSSLAVAIGYPDIASVGTTSLNQTGQAIECIALIAAVYLILNLVTAMVMGVVNRSVQIREH